MKKFAHAVFVDGSTILNDGYRSYILALESYTHEYSTYDPDSGLLHWLHIVVKVFILGTYHSLPKANLQSYLNKFYFRFSRRSFGRMLLDRLAFAIIL